MHAGVTNIAPSRCRFQRKTGALFMQSDEMRALFNYGMNALGSFSPGHMPEGDRRHIADANGGHSIKNSRETYAYGDTCQLKCAGFPFEHLMQPVRTGARFGRATEKPKMDTLICLSLR